jgi:hypothetical protein
MAAEAYNRGKLDDARGYLNQEEELWDLNHDISSGDALTDFIFGGKKSGISRWRTPFLWFSS